MFEMKEASGGGAALQNGATDLRSPLPRDARALGKSSQRMAAPVRTVRRPPIAIVVTVGIAATLVICQRIQARRERSERAARLLELLRPSPPPEKGFLRQTLEKTAGALLAISARRLGYRDSDRLLDGARREPC